MATSNPTEPDAAEPDEAMSAGDELEDEASAPPDTGLKYGKNLILFLLTVVSVFYAGAAADDAIPKHAGFLGTLKALPAGYSFAVPLLAILLTHEFGHYFAARYHKVPASLPFFIPLPLVSPFGTMGAVISMRDRIRSKNALLDIGASGPIAGMIIAIPVLCYGIAISKVELLDGPFQQEGQSLLYLGLKRIFAGPIPVGSDLKMSPVAFAGWVGTLVTMINLVPVGQLDGGHVAYALFGPRQNRYAKWFHLSLLLVFAYNVWRFILPFVAAKHFGEIEDQIGNVTSWLVWFGLLAGMKRMAGINHPPTDPSVLSPARKGVAVGCLALFVLLFMPTPWGSYQLAMKTFDAKHRSVVHSIRHAAKHPAQAPAATEAPAEPDEVDATDHDDAKGR